MAETHSVDHLNTRYYHTPPEQKSLEACYEHGAMHSSANWIRQMDPRWSDAQIEAYLEGYAAKKQTNTHNMPDAPTDPIGTQSHTARGFELVQFQDSYDNACSIQESSRASTADANGHVAQPLGWLWLGLDDAKPEIMKHDAQALGMALPPGEVSGWMPYPLPAAVSLSTRMHLNEQQVRGLVARLNHWLETGRLLTTPEDA